MERRRDPRHVLRYGLTLKCLRSSRIYHETATEDISASGARIRVSEIHDLDQGDRVEIQLYATVKNADGRDVLPMATRAIVTRTEEARTAVWFEAPLAY